MQTGDWLFFGVSKQASRHTGKQASCDARYAAPRLEEFIGQEGDYWYAVSESGVQTCEPAIKPIKEEAVTYLGGAIPLADVPRETKPVDQVVTTERTSGLL